MSEVTEMNHPVNSELPMGLSMALARNPAAMSAFAAMSPQEQRTVIAGAHQVRSAAEMRQYVASLQGNRF